VALFPVAEVTVICACGMTAPLGSNTRPCSVPVGPCPKTMVGEVSADRRTVIRVNKYFVLFICAGIRPETTLGI
jgi:hypothetical protein